MVDQTEHDRLIWSAGQLVALGVAGRLAFNRNRYQNENGEPVSSLKLRLQCDSITGDIQAYHNVIERYLTDDEPGYLAGALLLIQRITNELYTLHHTLLDLDPSSLAEIIPALDQEIRYWNDKRDYPEFLNEINSLEAEAAHLDEHIRNMMQIEFEIGRLFEI